MNTQSDSWTKDQARSKAGGPQNKRMSYEKPSTRCEFQKSRTAREFQGWQLGARPVNSGIRLRILQYDWQMLVQWNGMMQRVGKDQQNLTTEKMTHYWLMRRIVEPIAIWFKIIYQKTRWKFHGADASSGGQQMDAFIMFLCKKNDDDKGECPPRLDFWRAPSES